MLRPLNENDNPQMIYCPTRGDSLTRFMFGNIEDIFEHFRRSGQVLDYQDKTRRRVFIDNAAPVLYVAHLDTVQTPRIGKTKKGRIHGAGFDDRLGAALAIALNAAGYSGDILLCDLEESAASTAYYHDCKDYNWVMELDRAGDDFVTYGLGSQKLIDALERFMPKKHKYGVFSDICRLHSSAAMFNLGIGYHYAHATDSEIDIDQLRRQIDRFTAFYRDYALTPFEQDGTDPHAQYYYGFNVSSNYDDDDDLTYQDYRSGYWQDVCEVCNYEDGAEIHGHVICENCLDYLISEYSYLHDQREYS